MPPKWRSVLADFPRGGSNDRCRSRVAPPPPSRPLRGRCEIYSTPAAPRREISTEETNARGHIAIYIATSKGGAIGERRTRAAALAANLDPRSPSTANIDSDSSRDGFREARYRGYENPRCLDFIEFRSAEKISRARRPLPCCSGISKEQRVRESFSSKLEAFDPRET